MHNKHEYEIAFVGLKPGAHIYEYSVDDKFFEKYGAQDFKNCAVQIKLTLDKQTTLFKLKFEVGGKATVDCDRCSNDLELDLWEEFDLYIKYAENADELNDNEEDPDVFYINRNESILNVEDWIFEFVNLSIPYQRSCANDEIGGSKCNPAVLAYLKKSEENVKQAEEANKNVLGKLLNNDNNNKN
jgi:uncharacterized metal-binding protein YceD (DUF177 family)